MPSCGLIETDAACELWDYWNALRGDCQGVPGRESFSALRIPESLPYMFVTEPVDDGLTFRLMGTALAELTPPAAVQATSLDSLDSDEHGFFIALCHFRSRRAQVSLRWSRLMMTSGRRVGFEFLHLPMSGADRNKWQIFGCIVPRELVAPGECFAYGRDFERIDAIWLDGLDARLTAADIPADMSDYFARHRTPVHFAPIDTGLPELVPARAAG